MARGGYRKPNNPAPVSGPGSLSRRTDGGPGSKQAMQEIRTGKYGESKAIAEQQQAAPMAGNPMPTPVVQLPPLMAPTERPTEPLTQGMPFGPGATEVAFPQGGGVQSMQLAAALQPLLKFDSSGQLAALYEIAVKRGW